MPDDDVSPAIQTAAAFAENLARSYRAQGKDLVPLFAAFAGLVVHCNERVGQDVLTALDKIVNGQPDS